MSSANNNTRKKKRPAGFSVEINTVTEPTIDVANYTVNEFISFYFSKMREKIIEETEITTYDQEKYREIIMNLEERCINVYNNLINGEKYKYSNCSICKKCSDCAFNKTCSGENKVFKQETNNIDVEFEIFGKADEKGKDNTFMLTLTGITVCKITNKVVKKTRFKKEGPEWKYNLTLFILIWEIVMQNYVLEIITEDSFFQKHSTLIPSISEYYLHKLEDSHDVFEVVIIMEYIENEPLEFTNYEKAISILHRLKKKHRIFHNDTHTENIRQTNKGEIVLLDWGKGSIISIANPSMSGLYEEMSENVGFKDWQTAPSQLKEGSYFRENSNMIYGGKRKKHKKKHTRKHTHKKKLKKHKKYTKKEY